MRPCLRRSALSNSVFLFSSLRPLKLVTPQTLLRSCYKARLPFYRLQPRVRVPPKKLLNVFDTSSEMINWPRDERHPFQCPTLMLRRLFGLLHLACDSEVSHGTIAAFSAATFSTCLSVSVNDREATLFWYIRSTVQQSFTISSPQRISPSRNLNSDEPLSG